MAFKSRKQYDAYWQNRLNNYTAPTFNGLEYVPFAEFRAARHPAPGPVQGTDFVGSSSSTPGGSNASAGSSVLGELARSALGNVGGTALSTLANGILQHQQLKNQEQLQDRAQRFNQQAVQDQAQLQTIGMQNAGLNPASVQGSGAPSLQAGAAAGGSTSMANIFSGIAEIISAVKAPTEIDKMVAETKLTGAETGKTEKETESLIPAQVANLEASTNKAIEDTRSARNMNDVFDTQQAFLKDFSGSIWTGYKDMLLRSGQWDKLPDRTKETLDLLSSGAIDMDIGAIEGIRKLIDTQADLTRRDKEGFQNLLELSVISNQMDNKKVMKALEEFPENQRQEIVARIKNLYAAAYEAIQSGDYTKYKRMSDELQDPRWLMEFDPDGKNKFIRSMASGLLQGIIGIPESLTKAVDKIVTWLVGGKAAGGALNAGKNAANKEIKQLLKQNRKEGLTPSEHEHLKDLLNYAR